MTKTNVESRIPGLADIPLLGSLFRSSTSTYNAQNLTILVKPYLVDHPDDFAAIYKEKLQDDSTLAVNEKSISARFFGDKSKDSLRTAEDQVEEKATLELETQAKAKRMRSFYKEAGYEDGDE
jgi:type II secretory pathway component GspD/PulD (secretin)